MANIFQFTVTNMTDVDVTVNGQTIKPTGKPSNPIQVDLSCEVPIDVPAIKSKKGDKSIYINVSWNKNAGGTYATPIDHNVRVPSKASDLDNYDTQNNNITIGDNDIIIDDGRV